MEHTYPRAMALVASGLLRPSPLVTHRFPLDEHRTAFETAARRQGIKVLIEPSQ